MMRVKLMALVFLLMNVLSTPVPYAGEAHYSKNTSLPPIVLSFTDLEGILEKTSKLLSTANAQSEQMNYMRKKITISTGNTKVELKGHSLFAHGAKLPEAAYSLSYSYYLDDGSVSDVTLDFYDYSRRLSVSGSSPEQVDSIFTSLEKDLLYYSTSIGGTEFRNFAAFFLFMLLFISLILTGMYCWINKRPRAIGMPILSLLVLVLLLVLPFDKILPGFAIYNGDPSFLVRYAPQISFLGLIVSLLGIAFSYFLPKWFARLSKPLAPN